MPGQIQGRKLSSSKGQTMIQTTDSRPVAPTLALLMLGAVGCSGVWAEPVAVVNGVDIERTVLETYMQSRLQKPATEASEAERELVLQELTDIYLLTTQPRAKELAAEERLKAQAELQYRGLLTQAVASDYIGSNPASDAEILAAYDAQNEAAPSLQFKARHILVETQAAATDLITQLEDGADFAELAELNSTGPSGPNGGDLGWFTRDQMVKPFSDAVAALDDGQFSSAPVQTQFGWHVILREDSRENEAPSLDSVRDTLKQRVEQQKFQSYIESLRNTYEAGE